jgi:hypothetical protein
LSTDDLQHYDGSSARDWTVYVDAASSVIQRAVGDGFRETLTILNHDAASVDLAVRLDVGSDFADLFEVKDALKKKGTYRNRVEHGQLVLGYRRDTFERETVISSTSPAKIDQDGLTFKVRIEPHGQWATELTVATTRRHPGAGGARRDAPGPAWREAWRSGCNAPASRATRTRRRPTDAAW